MMRLILLQVALLFQGFFAIDPLENNGYKNVIVSIHPDVVPDDNGHEIFENIKASFFFKHVFS